MRLRHSIKFQNDTSTDSEVDPSYSDFLTGVPASIVPVGGGEVYNGRQLQSETTTVIECRYYANLEPNMIIVNELTSDTFYINRLIDMNGRHRWYLIECNEVEV